MSTVVLLLAFSLLKQSLSSANLRHTHERLGERQKELWGEIHYGMRVGIWLIILKYLHS